MGTETDGEAVRQRDVAALFLKPGLTAFGGPAAHVALIRREVVERRGRLSDDAFLDLFGASNLIPGPTSTELAIYLGLRQAGWRGMVLAGLGWTAIKEPLPAAIGAAVLVLYLAGTNPLLLLALGAFASIAAASLPAADAVVVPIASAHTSPPAHSLTVPFLTFLKIGAVLYGSGYVLLAFLPADFVGHLHWLTDRQILDAVAIGQFTPGPVFTTATAPGYLLTGFPGALAATLAIILPSFVLVTAVNPLVPRPRASPMPGPFLDGVNVAALGLTAGVTVQLAHTSIVDPFTAALALLAALLRVRFSINSAWLAVGGALAGVLLHVVG